MVNNKAVIELWLALLAGVVFVFAFAPFDVFPLVFVSLGMLFWLWLESDTPKRAFIIGWLFGLGQFGAGVSWMYVSLSTFGNMAPVLAGLAVFLLVMGLAIFPAVVGITQHFFKAQPAMVRLFFVMTPMWVLAEWVREWLFTGLPWLAAGYSQTSNILATWAPIGGIYLVSIVITLIVSSFLLLLRKQFVVSGACLLIIAIASYYSSQQQWTQDNGEILSVKLVQGNVSIWDKWNPRKTSEILNNYISLSQQGNHSDLVIWPEAAAPLYLSELPDDFWTRINQTNNSATMFGIVEHNSETGELYNSVISTQSSGDLGAYRKVQLVPFGEFLPLKFMLEWLLEYLQIPMSDFSAYKFNQTPIDVNGIKIGVSICYEDAFANVIRRSLPQANILVNVSEDAWFGNSLAPHQRLQMAQMRAIENGRSLIRVSNNGLSSIIDHRGKIRTIAPQFETIVLEGQAAARTGATPFSTWGHKLALSFLLLLLFVAISASILARKNNPK